MTHYILTLSCPDRFGIVAKVAGALTDYECNIEESAQFNDKLSGRFFMRVVLSGTKGEDQISAFKHGFKDVAVAFDMDWAIYPQNRAVKTLILVSKTDHCLSDILYRWRTNHLNIDIAGVVSNHETSRDLVEQRGIPFHYLPMNNKAEQEGKLSTIIEETGAELIVLARYMQILSDEMCTRYDGRIINIHHSFLPGFKGAKPYHQAYERGVKLIGATAHFATSDLDEGPIIDQDTIRIDHSLEPAHLQTLGRDTESKVLARAIALYTERRIFIQGLRTVIL